MFGNGISWTCLISLDLKMTEKGEYLLEKMTVQEGILELLRDLPVSSGLAIRRDVGGVEEFYSLISGLELNLERGFIDLTSLAILAVAELEINKFQPRIQNLEKVGDLEILEEELLIDMNHVEINKFRIQDGIVQDIGKISPDFQFKAQDHDGVEYLDKHEIGEINKFRIQDGIVLDIGRISPDFQFKTQDLERVGYRENLGENAPLSRLR